MSTQRLVCDDVHSSFIHTNKNWKEFKYPLTRGIDKWVVIYPYKWKLLRNNKNGFDTYNDTIDSPCSYDKWKNPDIKKYILYDFIYMKL